MTKLNAEQARLMWQMGDLSYKLHAVQSDIRSKIRGLPDSTQEALVLCSRRLGKSYLAACMAIEDCLSMPKSQVFICGPTVRQTRGITNGLIQMIIEDMPEGVMWQTKSENLWEFANGSKLILGGFDSALESFRGLFANNIYLEESGLAFSDSFDYTIKSVLLPTMQNKRPGKLVHMTTPAYIVDHVLHLDTIPKTQAAGSFFRYTIFDNPMLTKDQIEQEIYNLGGIDSSHCRRELLCELVRDESTTIVPQFVEHKHVAKVALPDNAHYWIAGDIGGSKDKTALLLMAYDYTTSKIHVVKEVVMDPKTPTPEIVKAGLAMEEGKQGLFRAIDAPGQLLGDFGSVYGYSCFLPEKLQFEHNIHRLQSAFWKDEVIVDPSCKVLIATLNSGQLNKQRTDFARSEALGHCDCMAALVYGLRHADKRVPKKAALPKSDSVWSPDAIRKQLKQDDHPLASLNFGGFKSSW